MMGIGLTCQNPVDQQSRADGLAPGELTLQQLDRYLSESGADSLSAITVDVFDTIMLRRARSEVRRHAMIAKRFVEFVRTFDPERTIGVDTVVWTRRQAQAMAFRARELQGYCQEVQLGDICDRQLKLMGLPESWAEHLVSVELDLESECLRPNNKLLPILRKARSLGIPVYAISDTTLAESDLRELIHRIIADPPLDRIYSSAQENATKRAGDLFRRVISDAALDIERVVHIGDNYEADVASARAVGFRTIHVPRKKSFIATRQLDGATHLIGRSLSSFCASLLPSGTSATTDPGPNSDTSPRFEFGRETFGPLLVDYALRLWLYLEEAARDGETTALFCARGGLLMRVAFERVLGRIGIQSSARLEDLMVSRLVCAQGALLRGSDATILEINREFKGMHLPEALESLANQSLNLSQQWDQPISVAVLKSFLASVDADRFKECLAEQNSLFEQHLWQVAGSPRRWILVDTGLFGSTLKMLQDAYPEISWEAVQLARSNYKGFETPHFAQTTGLWVQRDRYSPADNRTCILRYWHLIEGLFEPDLKSVTRFQEIGGQPVSNLEVPGWKDTLVPRSNELFRGALDYVDHLEPAGFATHSAVAAKAWQRLKTKVIYPGCGDLPALMFGERSRDFGSQSYVSTDADLQSPHRFQQLKTALWKAGAAVQLYPRAYPLIQRCLEVQYGLRAISQLRTGTS